MKLTKITSGKIKYLLSNRSFKSAPLNVLLKIIKWEIARIRNRKIYYKFDKTLDVALEVNEGVSRLTYYFGYSEPEIFNFLNSYLRKGMYFFDVGANIGLHSLFASKRIGTEGKVIAFEPSSSIFKRLAENVNLNKIDNIYIYEAGLGDKDCKMQMVNVLDDTSKTYIRLSENNGKEEKVEIVKIITMDNFVTKNNIRKIDYLKIDVEGYEFNVLKGAINTLTNIIPGIIQLETEPINLKRNNIEVNEIKSFTDNYKYIPFSLNENKNKLTPLDLKSIFPYNTFLIHKHRISEFSQVIE